MSDLVLASASPRRAQILRQIGVSFCVMPAEIDEQRIKDEQPLVYVKRMASEKAQAVTSDLPILTADTTVACDGRVLEKPADYDEAFDMLRWLSGNTQTVYSAIGLTLPTGEYLEDYSATQVIFRALTDRCIERYLACGEYTDKAGSYGIQGMGAALVERFEGSYTGVVGLSIESLVPLLEKAGVSYWNQVND